MFECPDDADFGVIKFANLSCLRYPEYQMGTSITGNSVEKFPLDKVKGGAHLKEIYDNENNTSNAGLNVCKQTGRWYTISGFY